jgi:hypothetical protein
MTESRRIAGPTPKANQAEREERVFDRHNTDREIRVSFERQASATKQRLVPSFLPILMRNTVFFFVSFH